MRPFRKSAPRPSCARIGSCATTLAFNARPVLGPHNTDWPLSRAGLTDFDPLIAYDLQTALQSDQSISPSAASREDRDRDVLRLMMVSTGRSVGQAGFQDLTPWHVQMPSHPVLAEALLQRAVSLLAAGLQLPPWLELAAKYSGANGPEFAPASRAVLQVIDEVHQIKLKHALPWLEPGQEPVVEAMCALQDRRPGVLAFDPRRLADLTAQHVRLARRAHGNSLSWFDIAVFARAETLEWSTAVQLARELAAFGVELPEQERSAFDLEASAEQFEALEIFYRFGLHNYNLPSFDRHYRYNNTERFDAVPGILRHKGRPRRPHRPGGP